MTGFLAQILVPHGDSETKFGLVPTISTFRCDHLDFVATTLLHNEVFSAWLQKSITPRRSLWYLPRNLDGFVDVQQNAGRPEGRFLANRGNQ
ncbi:unnamed protein product [Phytophthora fragariaefolia]|uniref:Unnamed protein product n=1 Tax=Phytophthora fragariaefolia TaxID=1490495 RepID=A0A9W6Y0P0_9STRA|nr:unnamed protein product [Phytophthora fragariaefolia]